MTDIIEQARTIAREHELEKNELKSFRIDRDKLRNLIPKEFKIPKPQDIPKIFEALKSIVWSRGDYN